MYTLPAQRKAATDKQMQPKPRAQKSSKQADLSPNPTITDYELDEPQHNPDPDPIQQRPKRLKRPTKSVNENIEPAFTASNPEH